MSGFPLCAGHCLAKGGLANGRPGLFVFRAAAAKGWDRWGVPAPGHWLQTGLGSTSRGLWRDLRKFLALNKSFYFLARKSLALACPRAGWASLYFWLRQLRGEVGADQADLDWACSVARAPASLIVEAKGEVPPQSVSWSFPEKCWRHLRSSAVKGGTRCSSIPRPQRRPFSLRRHCMEDLCVQDGGRCQCAAAAPTSASGVGISSGARSLQ